VKKEPIARGLKEKLLQDVRHNVEEERRKRVALMKPTPALDPSTRDAVEEDGSLTGEVKQINPLMPEGRKPFSQKDPVESFPADRVKGFPKVQLEHSGRCQPFVAGLNNVGGVGKVFSDGAIRNEARLIGVDKKGQERAKTKGETFGVEFKTTILKRDGSEVFRFVGPGFFREQDNEGFVDWTNISLKGMEGV
jgi:hypothetical protein